MVSAARLPRPGRAAGAAAAAGVSGGVSIISTQYLQYL